MTGYDIAFPFIMILWVVIMIGAGFYLITNEPISKNKSIENKSRENKSRAKAGDTQKAKGRNKTKNIKKEKYRNKSKNKK